MSCGLCCKAPRKRSGSCGYDVLIKNPDVRWISVLSDERARRPSRRPGRSKIDFYSAFSLSESRRSGKRANHVLLDAFLIIRTELVDDEVKLFPNLCELRSVRCVELTFQTFV